MRKLNQSSTLVAAEEASRTMARNVLMSGMVLIDPTKTLSGGTVIMARTKDGESSPLEESQLTDNH